MPIPHNTALTFQLQALRQIITSASKWGWPVGLAPQLANTLWFSYLWFHTSRGRPIDFDGLPDLLILPLSCALRLGPDL